MLSASMSIPCSSMTAMRSGPTNRAGVGSFNPINSIASGIWQCACTSIVRTRLPLITVSRSEEHTSELQSHSDLVCRLLLEKKKTLKDTYLHDADDVRALRSA